MATDQALNIIAASINRRRPNKPVLPTAHTSPNHYAPGSLRRQTGQPLDGRAHRESLVGDDLDATYV
jgi:hypothetical protein